MRLTLSVFLLAVLTFPNVSGEERANVTRYKSRNSFRRRGARESGDGGIYIPYCRSGNDIIDNDRLLGEKVLEAESVFTGKVNSEVRYVGFGTAATFNVSVKRSVKGPVQEGSVVRVRLALRDGEGVKCRLVVRYRYSAFFLARTRHFPDSEGGADVAILDLTIPPVPFTLRNLERINYSTKDVSYKPRYSVAEEPCIKTVCAWGADCVNQEGRAQCLCPTECQPLHAPVCGTDGKTYSNYCWLRVSSCQRRQNTKIRHVGECELNDPCREKQCGFGSRCVPTTDGRNATCRCPDRCPSYGERDSSHPVCGSDGRDYADQCQLRLAACQSNTNITIQFTGKCDPCLGVSCEEKEVCQLDEKREPVCRCGDTCPLEFNPVCGSDGKTYPNECSLRQEACRTRKPLRIIYHGKCSSGVNPCLSVRCVMGEECAINKFGIARCECPPDCEPVMRPVCSKDGRTFPSECEMKRAACLSGSATQLAYAGACSERGPCTEHVCEHGAVCVEVSGAAHCECPVCSAEFEPVCGSDGVSYGNECKLRLEACRNRKNVEVLYTGPCNGCENKKCDHYATCESDGINEGRCVCPTSCDEQDEEGAEAGDGALVCGTDGVTYSSECQLRHTSCRTKQYVLVAYKGDCDLCQGVMCKFGARCEAGECICPTECEGAGKEPVCASNMLTYSNECELQKAACLMSPGAPHLLVVFYGDCKERFAATGPATGALSTTTVPSNDPAGQDSMGVGTSAPGATDAESVAEREDCRDIICDYEATCELGPDNFPRCTCQFECPNQTGLVSNKPVCASDLRTYTSLCAMKMEACQRQEELRLRPLDLCQGMEVKPCNGEQPLRDAVTGKDLDCGNGPARQDCPSGSYCHQTMHFAKCCLKDQVVVEKSCEDSWFGCCPDGKTAAQGLNHGGCPSMCGCNRLGSYADTCDPETQQCHCKPGVGGFKCDRCEPGFWGLPKISSGHQGCIPCGCSMFGSVREDCEQMTGRCVCKPGIQGQKCTICTNVNKVLTPNGCIPVGASVPPATSCKHQNCYFGAICVERGGLAVCECRLECPKLNSSQIVCGSDGQTYPSECTLKLTACRLQIDVVVQAFGKCKEDMFPGTDWPVRHYTPLQYTQPDESNSPLSKSTRHLLVPDPRFYYDRSGSFMIPAAENFPEFGIATKMHRLSSSRHDSIFHDRDRYAAAYRPTPATVRVVMPLLGDLCSDNSECSITYSSCVGGACRCLPEYSESPSRQECISKDISTSGPTVEYQACTSSPCYLGSTCIDLPANTFNCICGANSTGPLCEIEVFVKQYDIPSFDGHSYVRLKPLRAYHKLSVEIEFKSYTKNGILLYNQQKFDGSGDFVSLALVNGFVEFRYNLGNGPVHIISLDKVHLKKFHKIVIKRYHRDGLLKLDDSEDVVGQSAGMLKALDLNEDAFIGNVPYNSTKIFENIGTNLGLVGCIRKFKIGRRSVELHENRDDLVINTKGVRECEENPCSSQPCYNGAQCHAVDSEMFKCICRTHFSGDLCEDAINPCLSDPCSPGSTCEPMKNGSFSCHCFPGRFGAKCEQIDNDMAHSVIPEFNGPSYIQFPRMESVGRTFTIEMCFLTNAANGLLLYNGQMKNGRGDFISLLLVRGHVQFRFNLGSGIANITSEQSIAPGEWYVVKIHRNGRQGSLQVDNGTTAIGKAGPPLTELNLELPFYVGSVPSWSEVHRLAGASKGFKGAIQRLVVNGKSLPVLGRFEECVSRWANATTCASKTSKYEGSPCPYSKNPCLNKGLCIPTFKNYICQCQKNYNGFHCENLALAEEWPIKFFGSTFLQYRNRGIKSVNNTDSNDYSLVVMDDDEEDATMIEMDSDVDSDSYLDYEDEYYNDDISFYDSMGRKGERGNRYEIKLKTSSANGLLLWRSKNKSLKNDYFSIAIVEGHPELSYNLGKQSSFWAIRSSTRVDDGEWHTLHIRRRKRAGFIIVDGGTPVRGLSNSGAISLSTNAKLWIGGTSYLPTGFPAAYYQGFKGCIQHVLINAKPLNLTRPNDTGTVLQFCHDNDI